MTDYFSKAKTMNLPSLPWTAAALGEDKYCELAIELGYFNPKAERSDYRPDLDPTQYLSLIPKPKAKAKSEE